MAKQFEWKDFAKKYSDLSTNNFPTLDPKTDNLQDNIKFKFSSKAQKGVKLDASVNNIDRKLTESEFAVKLNFDQLQGVELGLKAKSKPYTEFTLKFDDKIIPLEGASFTIKDIASLPNQQTIGGVFGFVNKIFNVNFGVSVPIAHKFFTFLPSPTETKFTNKDGKEESITVNPLDDQRTKVDLDFVAKPLDDQDIFVGGEVKTELSKGESSPFLYSSKFSVALNNKTTNGGLSIDHKKTIKKDSKDLEDKNSVPDTQHETSFSAWVVTEVDDLSGGAQVTYSPSKSSEQYKGFAFEVVTGLQRDKDSKLSTKIRVIPETTVSLGYEQKLSSFSKLSFGYAFALSEKATKGSAYSFGLEFSH